MLIHTDHVRDEWICFDRISNKQVDVHVNDVYQTSSIENVINNSDCAVVIENYLFDNCLFDQVLMQLVIEKKVKLFITMQYPSLPKWLIATTPSFCIFNDRNRRRIYEIIGYFESFEEFCNHMDTICKKYQCMYLSGGDQRCLFELNFEEKLVVLIK